MNFMATFEQNIRNIRGEAIYGPDMRTSIADAIQQAMALDINGNEGTVYFIVTPISGTDEDFFLTINNGE